MPNLNLKSLAIYPKYSQSDINIIILNEPPKRRQKDAYLVDEEASHVLNQLCRHVFNNPQRQNEIFDALSHHDLNKIILNLQDDNECNPNHSKI